MQRIQFLKICLPLLRDGRSLIVDDDLKYKKRKPGLKEDEIDCTLALSFQKSNVLS